MIENILDKSKLLKQEVGIEKSSGLFGKILALINMST